MSGTLAAWLGTSAVLACWCLGAYNRLVRLRQASAAAFGDVLVALAERHRLVDGWLAAARSSRAQSDERPDDDFGRAVEAACRQSQAAADHAAARPAAAEPLASLAVAEQLLRAALAQWSAAPPEAPAVLAAADSAWNAGRERFNAAAAVYNRAARQFPTRIVAWLFGFRPAGTL